MQINFFMSPPDEEKFVKFVRSKGGYFFQYRPKGTFHPVITSEWLPENWGVLYIANETRAPIPEAPRPRVLDPFVRFLGLKSSPRRGPGFTNAELSGPKGFRVEPIEFLQTNFMMPIPQPGRLWINGLEDETISFYQSLAKWIRKHYQRENGIGDWVGEGASPVLAALRQKTPPIDSKEVQATSNLQIFREMIEGRDLSGRSLEQISICRSELVEVSFSESDVSGSSLTWNDFSRVNFSSSKLEGADLRASQFERCVFDHANMSFSDLRHSDFEGCTFNGANLQSAKAAIRQRASLALTDAQLASIEWHDTDGEEPDGG